MSDNTVNRPRTLCKLLLVGDSGAGKTCLMCKFVNNTFTAEHTATIGIDLCVRHLRVDGYDVKLQIWDTAGQERFRSICSSYYRHADGLLVVFDITSSKSFENVTYWVQDVRRLVEYAPIILLGTKCEITRSRQVSRQTAELLAEELGLQYIEVSSKTGHNVDEAFMVLVSEVLSRKAKQKMMEERSNSWSLSSVENSIIVPPKKKNDKIKKQLFKCC